MKGILTFGLAWPALFWVWLVYQGEWDRYEWIAAAGAATAGAGFVTVVAKTGLLRFRIPLASIAPAAKVPLQVVVDFRILLVALCRRLSGRAARGRFVVRRFDSPEGGAAGAGDRAVREILATYSPNAYVVDVDPGRHRVLLHDLVPNRSSEEPA